MNDKTSVDNKEETEELLVTSSTTITTEAVVAVTPPVVVPGTSSSSSSSSSYSSSLANSNIIVNAERECNDNIFSNIKTNHSDDNNKLKTTNLDDGENTVTSTNHNQNQTNSSNLELFSSCTSSLSSSTITFQSIDNNLNEKIVVAQSSGDGENSPTTTTSNLTEMGGTSSNNDAETCVLTKNSNYMENIVSSESTINLNYTTTVAVTTTSTAPSSEGNNNKSSTTTLTTMSAPTTRSKRKLMNDANETVSLAPAATATSENVNATSSTGAVATEISTTTNTVAAHSSRNNNSINVNNRSKIIKLDNKNTVVKENTKNHQIKTLTSVTTRRSAAAKAAAVAPRPSPSLPVAMAEASTAIITTATVVPTVSVTPSKTRAISINNSLVCKKDNDGNLVSRNEDSKSIILMRSGSGSTTRKQQQQQLQLLAADDGAYGNNNNNTNIHSSSSGGVNTIKIIKRNNCLSSDLINVKKLDESQKDTTRLKFKASPLSTVTAVSSTVSSSSLSPPSYSSSSSSSSSFSPSSAISNSEIRIICSNTSSNVNKNSNNPTNLSCDNESIDRETTTNLTSGGSSGGIKSEIRKVEPLKINLNRESSIAKPTKIIIKPLSKPTTSLSTSSNTTFDEEMSSSSTSSSSLLKTPPNSPIPKLTIKSTSSSTAAAIVSTSQTTESQLNCSSESIVEHSAPHIVPRLTIRASDCSGTSSNSENIIHSVVPKLTIKMDNATSAVIVAGTPQELQESLSSTPSPSSSASSSNSPSTSSPSSPPPLPKLTIKTSSNMAEATILTATTLSSNCLQKQPATVSSTSVCHIVTGGSSGNSSSTISSSSSSSPSLQSSVPKLTIKTIQIPSSSSSSTSCSSLISTSCDSPTIPKLTIKSIPPLNESKDSNDDDNFNETSNTITPQGIIPKLTIKTGSQGQEPSVKTHQLEQPSSSCSNSSSSHPSINQSIPKLTIRTKSSTEHHSEVNEKIPKFTIKSIQESSQSVPKLTISMSESAITTSSNALISSTEKIPKLTVRQVVETDETDRSIPKLMISRQDNSESGINENKESSNSNSEKIPKITIKPIQQQQHDDMAPPEKIPKLTIKTSNTTDIEEATIERVPKLTIKTITEPENIEKIPKITIKPLQEPSSSSQGHDTISDISCEKIPKLTIKQQESDDIDKVPKLTIRTISSSCSNSSCYVEDNSNNNKVPKIKIKPIQEIESNTSTMTGTSEAMVTITTVSTNLDSDKGLKMTIRNLSELDTSNSSSSNSSNTTTITKPEKIPKLTIKQIQDGDDKKSPKLAVFSKIDKDANFLDLVEEKSSENDTSVTKKIMGKEENLAEIKEGDLENKNLEKTLQKDKDITTKSSSSDVIISVEEDSQQCSQNNQIVTNIATSSEDASNSNTSCESNQQSNAILPTFVKSSSNSVPLPPPPILVNTSSISLDSEDDEKQDKTPFSSSSSSSSANTTTTINANFSSSSTNAMQSLLNAFQQQYQNIGSGISTNNFHHISLPQSNFNMTERKSTDDDVVFVNEDETQQSQSMIDSSHENNSQNIDGTLASVISKQLNEITNQEKSSNDNDNNDDDDVIEMVDLTLSPKAQPEERYQSLLGHLLSQPLSSNLMMAKYDVTNVTNLMTSSVANISAYNKSWLLNTNLMPPSIINQPIPGIPMLNDVNKIETTSTSSCLGMNPLELSNNVPTIMNVQSSTKNSSCCNENQNTTIPSLLCQQSLPTATSLENFLNNMNDNSSDDVQFISSSSSLNSQDKNDPLEINASVPQNSNENPITNDFTNYESSGIQSTTSSSALSNNQKEQQSIPGSSLSSSSSTSSTSSSSSSLKRSSEETSGISGDLSSDFAEIPPNKKSRHDNVTTIEATIVDSISLDSESESAIIPLEECSVIELPASAITSETIMMCNEDVIEFKDFTENETRSTTLSDGGEKDETEASKTTVANIKELIAQVHHNNQQQQAQQTHQISDVTESSVNINDIRHTTQIALIEEGPVRHRSRKSKHNILIKDNLDESIHNQDESKAIDPICTTFTNLIHPNNKKNNEIDSGVDVSESLKSDTHDPLRQPLKRPRGRPRKEVLTTGTVRKSTRMSLVGNNETPSITEIINEETQSATKSRRHRRRLLTEAENQDEESNSNNIQQQLSPSSSSSQQLIISDAAKEDCIPIVKATSFEEERSKSPSPHSLCSVPSPSPPAAREAESVSHLITPAPEIAITSVQKSMTSTLLPSATTLSFPGLQTPIKSDCITTTTTSNTMSMDLNLSPPPSEITPTRTPNKRGRGRGGRGGRGRGSAIKSRPRCIGGLLHTPKNSKQSPFFSPEKLNENKTTIPQVFEEDTRMSADSIMTPLIGSSERQSEVINNEDTQSSIMSSTSVTEGGGGSTSTTKTTVKKKKPKSKMEVLLPEGKTDYTVDMIAEYDWPPPKGCCPARNRDTFMIQEQIAQYLGIKSFKRKYPDLPRRQIDMEERNWLQEKGLVTEKMCDLGITAVWASDVLDIMCNDFYEKYEEYKSFIRQKYLRDIEAKQKASAANEVDRTLQARDRALQSAARWNLSFNRERKEDRRLCLDLQNLIINVPAAVGKRLSRPNTEQEIQPPSYYPIALVPGQFSEHYHHYTPEELRQYPINTVLDLPDNVLKVLQPKIDEKPIDEDIVKKEELEEEQEDIKLEKELIHENSENDSDSSSQNDSDSSSDDETDFSSSSSSDDDEENYDDSDKDLKCFVCHQTQNKNLYGFPEVFVRCYTCRKRTHPSCIEMPHRMANRTRNYNWQCAECKCCIKCKRKTDESKMIYCEQCDRGYHIYCVKIKNIPEGRWHCERCTICMKCGTNKPEGNETLPQPSTNSRWKPKRKWMHEYRVDPITKLREHISILCAPCAKLKRNHKPPS